MRTLKRFGRDESGLAAVEFALVLPVMLVILVGGSVLSNILDTHRRMTNVAATTADLVAQAKVITNQDMTDVFSAADALMLPYDPSQLTVVVTSVVMSGGQPTVAWSDGYRTNGRVVGEVLDSQTLPTGIIGTGTSVIMSEVTYHATDPIGMFFPSGLNYDDKFFDRPRRAVAVARSP